MRNLDQPANRVANDRAPKVNVEYCTHANKIDSRCNHGDQAVSRRLRGLGPVIPLVFGRWGEASDEVEEVVQGAAARAGNLRWRTLGMASPEHATAFYVHCFRCMLSDAWARSFSQLFVRLLGTVTAGRDARRTLCGGRKKRRRMPASDDEAVALMLGVANPVNGAGSA